MLCSKSALVDGRRQPGPVHVACRIWVSAEQDPGIVTLGLVPVVALARGDGLEGDKQVLCPGVPVANVQVP